MSLREREENVRLCVNFNMMPDKGKSNFMERYNPKKLNRNTYDLIEGMGSTEFYEARLFIQTVLGTKESKEVKDCSCKEVQEKIYLCKSFDLMQESDQRAFMNKYNTLPCIRIGISSIDLINSMDSVTFDKAGEFVMEALKKIGIY